MVFGACISKIPPCNIFDFVFRDCDAVSELPHSEVGAFLVDQGSIHQVLAGVNVDPPVLSQAKHLSIERKVKCQIFRPVFIKF